MPHMPSSREKNRCGCWVHRKWERQPISKATEKIAIGC